MPFTISTTESMQSKGKRLILNLEAKPAKATRFELGGIRLL